MPVSGLAPSIGGGGGGAGTPPQSGPDFSGVMMLGNKLEQGLLALSQAIPSAAGQLDQARELMMDALAQFAATASSMTSQDTQAPKPQGLTVTGAGSQFPGSQRGGRPF